MKFITKKRLAVAAIPMAGVLSYAGFAFANSTTVSSTDLGSGTSAVAANCSVAESYTTAYDAGGAGGAAYYVTSVTTTPTAGSTNGCKGKSFKVTLADSSSTSLQQVTGSFTDDTTAVTKTLSPEVLASSVANVYAVVTG